MDNLTVWALAIPIIWWVLLAIWKNRPRGFIHNQPTPHFITQESVDKKIKEVEELLAFNKASRAKTMEAAKRAHDMAPEGGPAQKIAAEKIKKFS